MAGPSLLSGVTGGVVPGQQAPDYSPIAEGVGKMMDRLVQAEMMKKQSAGDQLTKMIQLVDAGFPLDPNALRKTAKQAGMPVMKNEDMAAHVDAMRKGGGSSAKPNDPTQIKPSLPGVTPQQGTAGPQSSVQGVMQGAKNVEQARGDALDHWVQRSMQTAQLKGMQGQALLEYGVKVAQLKNEAAGGNKESLGQLWRLGELPFDVKQVQWDAMSPEQKSASIDIAAGNESPHEFATRRDGIAKELMNSGKYKDPTDATKAADALARGQAIPAGVQAKATPFTFKDLTEQAELMNQMVLLGVPNDQIATRATAAQTGGFQAAFPAGLKLNPIPVQELDLKRQQMAEQKRHDIATEGIEGGRLKLEVGKMEIEIARYNMLAGKADLESKKEEAKEDFMQFQSLVDVKKAGGKVDDTILQAAQEKVARRLGVETHEVNNWFHWLTGGTHLEFTPKPASDLAKKAAGSKPGSAIPHPESPGIGDVYNAIKKQMKPPKPEDEI